MTLWMKILWMKYNELIPAVEQLETVTKEVAQGGGGADLETYQSAIESGLVEAENVLKQYTKTSTDPAAVALRTKVKNFQGTKDAGLSQEGLIFFPDCVNGLCCFVCLSSYSCQPSNLSPFIALVWRHFHPIP